MNLSFLQNYRNINPILRKNVVVTFPLFGRDAREIAIKKLRKYAVKKRYGKIHYCEIMSNQDFDENRPGLPKAHVASIMVD